MHVQGMGVEGQALMHGVSARILSPRAQGKCKEPRPSCMGKCEGSQVLVCGVRV